MDLIDRYMHAVAAALPQSRRDEITRELRANILDKLEAFSEEKGRDATDAEVSEMLKGLGHPQKVANSFLAGQQLVNADLFPLYKRSLHYGVIVVFILALIKFGVHFISSGQLALGNFLYEIINKALLMFASVTGVFYLLSNPVSGKPYFDPYQCWSPEKLPPATRSWQRISACEQSFNFGSEVFFLLAINYTLWIPSGQLAHSPITFADPVVTWIPVLSLAIIASLILGGWKLIYRYWTVPSLIADAVVNIAIAIPLLMISRIQPIIIDLSVEQSGFIGIANQFLGYGLFWVGIWLMFMAGWRIYRAFQLSR